MKKKLLLIIAIAGLGTNMSYATAEFGDACQKFEQSITDDVINKDHELKSLNKKLIEAREELYEALAVYEPLKSAKDKLRADNPNIEAQEVEKILKEHKNKLKRTALKAIVTFEKFVETNKNNLKFKQLLAIDGLTQDCLNVNFYLFTKEGESVPEQSFLKDEDVTIRNWNNIEKYIDTIQNLV
ncbi:MAG TPA: hypothetical protein QGF02_04090 [Candidatus Babeliales bacterium]|nr:hypothetical protein [Candidatus Babeliales bacterium]